MADIRTMKRYAGLCNEKAELEGKLTAVKKKMVDLTDPVLAYFESQGIDKITTLGRTLYLRRELWAKRVGDVSAEQACEGLKAAGYDSLVKEGVSSQSISALLREREKDGKSPVPDDIAAFFEASEIFKIGSRTA